MRTFHESDIRKRILLSGIFFIAWFAVILVRLAQLQVLDHAHYKDIVQYQNQQQRKIQSRRGMIYDRNMKILGSSSTVFSVALKSLGKETAADQRNKLRRLAPVIGLSDKDMADALERLQATARYTYVKKKVPEEKRAAVKALKINGLEFEDGHARYYPLGSLAAHVLGGVDAEENGRAGVERSYNTALKGKEGKQIVSVDSKKREYQTQIVEAPVPGADLVLTLDANIQYIAERALAKAVSDQTATWGTVIICEPETGDILAMASYPTFDVNGTPENPEDWTNRAVQYSYEPGSTFKIVTAAAALEKGVVRYSDTFDCSAGSITVGGLTIRDHERMGVLTFPEVIIRSSNVGAVQVARRLAPTDFYRTIRSFGIGERTGIDLPAEDSGRVWPVEKWNKLSSVPHIAIGYETRTTALQVLMAMDVYATRGKLVRPRLVKECTSPQGSRVTNAAPPHRILDAQIAEDFVTRALENVVERGTAKAGRLEEFKIAGKTGTSQIFDSASKAYTSAKHIASFTGFVPSERPALTMIVVLADPKGGFYYGGEVCAPIFRDIALQTLRYLHVAPEMPAEDAPAVTGDKRKSGE